MIRTNEKEPRIKLNTINMKSHYLDDDLRKNHGNDHFTGIHL